ncbi:extracellular solute-binding protein [Leucobacter luti]|uniref:Putative spermidine/putrescine transport system substrate-binding protein n=1 Tax=Leucobacter luti TaxID=340320 RepID=A0A4Q7U0M0_9MICO|nr:extracellular solute-binding protein [Leucobacter luti]MBL3699375.1 extracellular solute-binding protein [Leucobacter luti]RZT66885.1 putative spermidine/putrescine transport system substrate-binding protein [Leucobacter luti]
MKIPQARAVSFGALTLAGALALTGCSAAASDSGSDSGSDSAVSGEVLFYDTSGGDVWEGLNDTLFADFTEETGVKVVDDYNEASTKFFAAAQNGAVDWSLVFLPSLSDAQQAADNGYLAKIDTSVVPVDQLADGTYSDTGIEVGTFGMVLAWNSDTYPADAAPKTWADLYDTEKFPGQRCFFNNPQYGWTLESALLADGVAADDLYPLDTERAFAKLDTVKDSVTWWSSGAQSIESFENGSCDLGIVWANRAFTASQNGFPLSVGWDQAGYANSVWAIPADAPNPAAAQALLKSVIENTAGQIEFASRVPTPIPAASTGISVGDFPEDIQPFLPVGDNIENAIVLDAAYYKENNAELTDQFNRWVAK